MKIRTPKTIAGHNDTSFSDRVLNDILANIVEDIFNGVVQHPNRKLDVLYPHDHGMSNDVDATSLTNFFQIFSTKIISSYENIELERHYISDQTQTVVLMYHYWRFISDCKKSFDTVIHKVL